MMFFLAKQSEMLVAVYIWQFVERTLNDHRSPRRYLKSSSFRLKNVDASGMGRWRETWETRFKFIPKHFQPVPRRFEGGGKIQNGYSVAHWKSVLWVRGKEISPSHIIFFILILWMWKYIAHGVVQIPNVQPAQNPDIYLHTNPLVSNRVLNYITHDSF